MNISRSDEMTEKKKPSKVKLVPTPDGGIALEPYENTEPDPVPAEDGKYYLECTSKAVELAWTLGEQGTSVYCAVCKARLTVTEFFIICPTSQNHFMVMT
jgi:hypothetical protein